MPVGYAAGADAYRAAVAGLSAEDLSAHYTRGLEFFHETFVPELKQRLTALSGGAWNLADVVGYAAGSDVDFMTHVIEAVAARERVVLYPGDWFGFKVGSSHPENLVWDESGRSALACLCIPSVRNGHLTQEMVEFLEAAEACLLNLNLFPTLDAAERSGAAQALNGVLEKSLLSISFSRGFGLTASQLGVVLVHRDHPFRKRFATQWDWFTYFYNALAARAFLTLDTRQLEAVDQARREWVVAWLEQRGLPALRTGSYYVRSFRVVGAVPEDLKAVSRDGLVRLCFKPPQT